ncbi:MAG: glycosyltransferase family 39 protein [Geodermatophilaceae bacterium]|nr:glycosyltransferase family 39 protein [Geodermatophilaceae bacterium]
MDGTGLLGRTLLLRGLGFALILHVAARAVGLAVLSLMAGTAGQDPRERLAIWDGGWYLRIAENGYAAQLDLTQESTGSLGFYPLYPLLIRLISAATGLDGLTSAVLISELAAAVAAVGLYTLAVRLWSPQVGVALVLLWSAQPLAIVLSMAYTEALFSALAVWSLVLLHRHNWLAAGCLGFLAGLSRSSGLGVGAAVAAYAGWLWWRREQRSFLQLAGALIALAGAPLWWLYIGVHVGRLDAWFAVQDEIWGSRWDWGASVVGLGHKLFIQEVRYSGDAVFVITLTFALLILAVVLLLEAVARRVWWPLLVYAVVLLLLTLGSAGFINSKPRFLVPIFPLLVPLAMALAGAARRVQVMVGLLVTVASAWFGAFLLVVWQYSI